MWPLFRCAPPGPRTGPPRGPAEVANQPASNSLRSHRFENLCHPAGPFVTNSHLSYIDIYNYACEDGAVSGFVSLPFLQENDEMKSVIVLATMIIGMFVQPNNAEAGRGKRRCCVDDCCNIACCGAPAMQPCGAPCSAPCAAAPAQAFAPYSDVLELKSRDEQSKKRINELELRVRTLESKKP